MPCVIAKEFLPLARVNRRDLHKDRWRSLLGRKMWKWNGNILLVFQVQFKVLTHVTARKKGQGRAIVRSGSISIFTPSAVTCNVLCFLRGWRTHRRVANGSNFKPDVSRACEGRSGQKQEEEREEIHGALQRLLLTLQPLCPTSQ